MTLKGFEIREVKDMNTTAEGPIDIRCKLNPDTKTPLILNLEYKVLILMVLKELL